MSIGDIRLFFDVVGPRFEPQGPAMKERPTLLVLHGGPGADHSLFRPDFDALADVAQVIYLDHRGQGRSDPGTPDTWHLARWADDVVRFCEALEIKKPVVLGQSFGGMVAMAYATRHAEHPGKLILANTFARQNLPRMLDRFEQRGGAEARAAAEAFWTDPSVETTPDYARLAMPLYSRHPPDADGFLRVVPRPEVGFHFLGGEVRSFDLLPDLAKIRCPTLVVGAAQDPVSPIEDQEEIAEALPAERVRFERLEEASHLCWLDQPERLFGVLRRFVRE